jgi:hypothetical protein
MIWKFRDWKMVVEKESQAYLRIVACEEGPHHVKVRR